MTDIRIDSIRPQVVNEILKSSSVSNHVKAEIIKANPEILKSPELTISSSDYKIMMESRPLIKYRPLKNSFTKQGDMKILAQSLGIEKGQINNFINNIVNTNFDIQHGDFTKEDVQKVKEYVFRHGSKSQVVAYVAYQLSDVNTVLTSLYKTLDNDLSEYYKRPIHRMSNDDVENLYNTVDSKLSTAEKAGAITADQHLQSAKDTLSKIYQIQSNQKILKAAEFVNENTEL